MVEINDNEHLNSENTELVISKDFIKIIRDLTQDLMTTFSDILGNKDNPIKEIAQAIQRDDNDRVDELIKIIYLHCKNIFPQHFFDILYENNDIFKNNKTLYLLPNIDFVELWETNITDATKTTIWKYLQLILFTVVVDINTGESFGDTAKLFEAINTDEFKEKIEKSLEDMASIFKQKKTEVDNDNNDKNDNENNIPVDLPNAEQLHDHINKMMGGKIGCLAKEIAEETAKELDFNIHEASSVNDVFNQMFKNPSKLMSLVKNIGTKLDDRIKSGKIKETELLQEASDLIANMKNMPGMGNLESLFSKMGMPGMPGAKIDIEAMSRKMQNNLKIAKTKERMRDKLDKKKILNDQNKEFGDSIAQEITDTIQQFEKLSPQNKPNKKKKNKK